MNDKQIRTVPISTEDNDMVEFEKIAVIENEIEALYLSGEFEKRGISHAMRSYHDSAYDGLFQFSAGWGHVEAPAEFRDEIIVIR